MDVSYEEKEPTIHIILSEKTKKPSEKKIFFSKGFPAIMPYLGYRRKIPFCGCL